MQGGTTLRSVRALQPGFVLGRYIVVDRIGAGGMAELYLARVDGPPRFAKPVALKLLHPHLAEDPEFVRMFEKEARIAATLDHPNIVQVLDVDRCGNDNFLALEYVDGRDLRKIVSAGGPLGFGVALRIVADVARALHDAHHRRDANGRPLEIVHRDVSPANILVAFSGAVKLTDFGVARAAEHTQHTRTGTLKGKFGYMAPEQYLLEPLDGRSDLFALGIVLYEITTGRRAFAGEQTFSIMNKVLAGEIEPPTRVVPGYPLRVQQLVEWAMALEREDRPSTAGIWADAVEQVAADLDLDLRPEAVAAEVRARFGDPPPPALDVVPLRTAIDAATTVGLVEAAGRRSSVRRTIAVAALVSIGVGVGSFVGWSAAPRGTAAAETSIAAPVVEPAPTPVLPAPVVPAAPEIDARPTESTATPVATNAGRTKPTRKRPPPRTRTRTTDDEPEETKALAPRDGMFPTGMK